MTESPAAMVAEQAAVVAVLALAAPARLPDPTRAVVVVQASAPGEVHLPMGSPERTPSTAHRADRRGDGLGRAPSLPVHSASPVG